MMHCARICAVYLIMISLISADSADRDDFKDNGDHFEFEQILDHNNPNQEAMFPGYFTANWDYYHPESGKVIIILSKRKGEHKFEYPERMKLLAENKESMIIVFPIRFYGNEKEPIAFFSNENLKYLSVFQII